MTAAIFCDLSALSPDQRRRHDSLAEHIFAQVETVTELTNGYAFRLPVSVWTQAVEWVPLERLCCPFFDFRLELRADGVLWLSLTGPEGVKDLLRAEMQLGENQG